MAVEWVTENTRDLEGKSVIFISLLLCKAIYLCSLLDIILT